METGKITELMLLWDIKDRIPTAQEVAKAIVEEEAKRREDEKAYWEAWDKAYREGVVEDLKNEKSILTWNKKDIYPHIDGIKQAELIERGELKIIALRAPINIITAMWANEEREEAKDPNYIALQASNQTKRI